MADKQTLGTGKPLTAPFPYFGGKSKAAQLIWSRFGTDCWNYVEPFFGSGAVWLGRPVEFRGWSTVNDFDGLVSNFWRAVNQNPTEVAEAACWPVNECDLHARHLWLVTNRDHLTERLMADQDFHDARAAGWWAWGACLWIGSGWCSGEGPWHAEPDADGVATFVCSNGGAGVNRKCDNRLEWLNGWFSELSAAMEDTRICCGDWKRIMSVGTMTRNGRCAVLLDPPYSQTKAVYACDSKTVSGDVRAWCAANGNNPMLRIALCGHAGEHEALEADGWTVETWDKPSGYQGADDRERIWFSPACLQTDAQGILAI